MHGIIASLNNAFQLVSGESYAQKLVYKFCHEIQALSQNKIHCLNAYTKCNLNIFHSLVFYCDHLSSCEISGKICN